MSTARQVTAFAVTVLLLAACAKPVPPPVVDVRPIGQGIEFLGIALVLAALIFVFGKFLGGNRP